ncbi:MAG: hypothetical protein GY802_04010, partial [Gammaproteobacteria bacterium]|nr:hypothetical protein [Gammaproteobacteria bacterium]
SSCLPELIRNFRVESICESAFSASLKEMALADMGLAWLPGDIIRQEIADNSLVSYGALLGEVELDIVLYYRTETLAVKVGEAIAAVSENR